MKFERGRGKGSKGQKDKEDDEESLTFDFKHPLRLGVFA